MKPMFMRRLRKRAPYLALNSLMTVLVAAALLALVLLGAGIVA